MIRKNRDKFAGMNKTRNTGRVLVVTAAVLAICITGVLCARKLQLEQKYISMECPIEYTVENISV